MHVFYEPGISTGVRTLNTEESGHCIRTLRHKPGDGIEILNGAGERYSVQIIDAHPKKCSFGEPILLGSQAKPTINIHLAIAPTKNMDRMEWMVEKCCELGVQKISFLRCDHSERKVIKLDRLEKKTIAALKQSKNLFKTELEEIQGFAKFLDKITGAKTRVIAIVESGLPHITHSVQPSYDETVILVGPEGDFSPREIELALDSEFSKVSLGDSVLRTETAGLLACHATMLGMASK